MNREPFLFFHIEKHYGDRPVLNIERLTLQPGRIQHLAGRNGAGKTTLLKILAGLEIPDHCEVHRDGHTETWAAARQRLRRDVVYLHQQAFMFDTSVERNLDYGLRVNGIRRDERRRRVGEALERMELTELARRNARTLSGGERQRLALARAWVLHPRVLLLDEPTANMDQEFRRQTWTLLQRMCDDRLAILVSSHELSGTGHGDIQVLQLQDGRLSAARPALQLVATGQPQPAFLQEVPS